MVAILGQRSFTWIQTYNVYVKKKLFLILGPMVQFFQNFDVFSLAPFKKCFLFGSAVKFKLNFFDWSKTYKIMNELLVDAFKK